MRLIGISVIDDLGICAVWLLQAVTVVLVDNCVVDSYVCQVLLVSHSKQGTI